VMSGKVSELQAPLDALIARAVDGDRVAFGALYRELSGTVYATICRQLGPSPDVEDLVQKVFLKVHRELVEFRGEKPFRAWLKCACGFIVCDHLRERSAKKREAFQRWSSEQEIVAGSSAETPEHELLQSEIRRMTYQALEKMKPEKRMALVMHDFEGFTLLEIAEMMRCSKFTARTRLVRGRRDFAAVVKRNTELMQLIDRGVA
jgi:RNA polymerase sigma-70 factor, ECF subfamily